MADKSRLIILWLLPITEKLCFCDIMSFLEITQSKASRRL
ncbi:MAG TPA: hypothetical protein DCY27_12435 [Desulfobacterales bacterium]|nr:hypothetical protein [Desulfobacterales bacterium]